MKKIIVFVLISILVLLLAGVVYKQKGESDSMQEKTIRSVGNAIEGAYRVSVSSKYIGELVIQQGNYSFSPINNPSKKSDVDFFYRYPKGTYEIEEYYGTVTSSSALEDLENNEPLLRIAFLSGDGTRRTYLIRNAKVHQEVYFDSLFNELQIWDIRKSWDS